MRLRASAGSARRFRSFRRRSRLWTRSSSSILPSAGKLAYPIVTFTYVIVPTNTSKAADLRKMIYWAVTSGQKLGVPLLFSPLPKPVQAYAFREIKKIQAT